MENLKVIQSQNEPDTQIKNVAYSNEERFNWPGSEETFSRIMSSEGFNNFADYIELLGLKNDPNMVILPSKNHYYYDQEELKNVNTITNLKELNRIKHVKNFLHSVRYVLHQRGNLIGYFTDISQNSMSGSIFNLSDYNTRENGITPIKPFLKMVFNMLGAMINICMTKKSVRIMLEDNGFKVIDMTDLNGLTYFHAQIV